MSDFVFHEETGIYTLDGRVLSETEAIEWLEWFGEEKPKEGKNGSDN